MISGPVIYFLTCVALALILGVFTLGARFPLLWLYLTVAAVVVAFAGYGTGALLWGFSI